MSPEYLAGLYDGEGYFSFKRVKGSTTNKTVNTTREWRFQAYAFITIREKWLLDMAVQTVGAGHVKLVSEAKGTHSSYYIIMWCGKALEKFLEVVGPHLIAKKKQCNLIKEIVAIKQATSNRPTTDAHYKRQCELFDAMKLLNKKGIGK